MRWIQRLVATAALIGGAAVGCNLVMGLDPYRACAGSECFDAGADAAADANDAAPLPCMVNGQSCTDSSQCSAPTPVCSRNVCVGVNALAHGQSSHECALLADCTLRCWGDNSTGALGTGDFSQATNPVAAQGIDDVLDVGVGLGYTCARRHDKTVWCWGGDTQGALGQGAVGPNLPTPTKVALPASTQVNALAVGENAACATLSDQSVYCWGGNASGAVASGGPAAIPTPTALPVGSHAVTAVAVASDATCVFHDQNVVDCFGNNLFGIFGTGMTLDKPGQTGTFTLLGGPIEELRGGEVQMCARHRESGEVAYCWGGNYFGCAIADGQASGQAVPNPSAVPLVGSVIAIEPSYRHSCGLIAGGDVYCWGQNDHGQSGQPPNANAVLPTKVTIPAATEIATHRQFSCAVVQSGDVECWGDNAVYQLGDGTMTDRYKAAPVAW